MTFPESSGRLGANVLTANSTNTGLLACGPPVPGKISECVPIAWEMACENETKEELKAQT